MTKLTIIDLARQANVSIKTISRVLNKEAGVGAEKRAEIEKLIAETGFTPNASARALSSSRSYLIGLIFERALTHYYLHELQMGAMRACRRGGYHLIIEQTEDLMALHPDALAKHLASSRFDGVVLVPPVCDNHDILAAFEAIKVPFVRIAPSIDLQTSSYVYMDDETAAYEMVAHLIRLGHKKIAYIENMLGLASNVQRKAGYLRALLDHNIDVRPEWIVGQHVDISNGFEDAEKLLSLPVRPTAIFAATDFIAFGAMAAAGKLGLSVPRDISIVGFDDSPGSESVWPPLTTIHQPIALMAETATDLLLGQLGGQLARGTHQVRKLDYHIVDRRSAAPPVG